MACLNLLSSPGQLNPVVPHLANLLETNPDVDHLQAAVPFLSWAGLKPLLNALESTGRWPVARSDWLIGLTSGITEPAALESLADLTGSRVRLFTGRGGISRESLLGVPQFHAKVFQLDVGQPSNRSHLICTSANITMAALGPHSKNFEAGISRASSPMTDGEIQELAAWWRRAVALSTPCTPRTLQRYVELRSELLDRNPDLIAQMDPPVADGIDVADDLWIQAGAMSGGSRNQIEFSGDAVGFFSGRDEAVPTTIHCVVGHSEFGDRPLTNKTTTFNVEIWRLSLPTTAQCGFDYPGNIIRFTRRTDGASHFTLQVAPEGSDTAKEWARQAHRKGYVGSTSGGRSFGYF